MFGIVEASTLYEEARARYYEAVDGRKEALSMASQLFDKVRAQESGDARVMAYTGSIRLMEADRAMAPWKKGRLAKEGVQLLDQAVKAAPNDIEVRFVRAASTSHLPRIFGRARQSEADFAWLADRVSAAAKSGVIEARLAAAALYHHGANRDRAGDRNGARAAWTEAARVGDGTRAGADARKRLASLGG
jgi:hypothetical protein